MKGQQQYICDNLSLMEVGDNLSVFKSIKVYDCVF